MTRREEDPNFLFKLQIQVVVDGKLRPVSVYAFEGNYNSPLEPQGILVEVTHCGKVVFPLGQLYCGVNEWTDLDSDAAKRLVLELVAMKPGDTDSDYFKYYTDEQRIFAAKYGELISMTAEDRFPEKNR